MKVKVERQTGTRYKSNDGVWEDLGTFAVSGESGWNSIPVANNFGGGWTQNSNIYTMRFTFWAESMLPTPAASQTGCCGVMGIVALNHIMWKASGLSPEMQRSGLPCAIAYDGSVTFPANVKAPTFEGKFKTARELAVSLSNTSTDTSFDGSANVTNIKTMGTLGVGNGGTGRTSVTSGSYVVGAGTSAMVEKTPKDVGSDVLSSLDDKSNASSYADFVDGDFVVGSDHVDASTISASTFVRRTALNLWNYIKSKLSGSDVNIGGNAATATNATTAGTAKAYDTSFSGTNSIASKFGTKADDISYSDGSPDASLNLGARLLAGVLLPTSSLGSMRLSVVLAIDLNISGSDVKGGILRADVAMNSGGSYFVKNCWLTGVTGSLSVSDFKVAYGTGLGNKKAVGIIWDGAIDANRKMHARVIDYYAEGGDFVFNADVANVTASSFSMSHVSAADDKVVHTTGDESVGGKKTFTDPVVESVSTSGDYSGFFVQRGSTAATRYRASLEVEDSGSRGLFDYGGSSYAGENKWIIRKKSDNSIDVGEASNRNKVRLGGVTLDFSGVVGNVADTFYIAN